MKRSAALLEQIDSGVYIKLFWRKDNHLVIGCLTDVTGKPLPGYHRAQHTIRPPETAEGAAGIVKRRLLEQYREKAAGSGEDPGNQPYTSAWKELCRRYPTPGKLEEVLNWKSWARSTYRSTVSYLYRQILPRLDKLGLNPSSEDIKALQAELVEQASNSKISLGIEEQARKNLLHKLWRCHDLYVQMRTLLPHRLLPELDLRMEGCTAPDMEQCKSLPDQVRITFAALLLALVPTIYGGIALSLAFMLLCGLRTGESGALFFSDLVYCGEVCLFWVHQQLDGSRAVPILKTFDSYRRLPAVKLLRDMLELRRNWLEEQGYTPEQIQCFPISGHPANPAEFASANLISAAGRILLQLCGCSESYWDGLRSLMGAQADLLETGVSLSDITAYALRRDFASRAANICGVNNTELDFALGHKTDHIRQEKRAFFTEDSLLRFCRKLEGYVFLPDHSGNPAYLPVPIPEDGETVTLTATQANFVVPKGAEFVLRIQTLDAGQSVRIQTSGAEVRSVKQFSAEDLPEERHARPLLLEANSRSICQPLIDRVSAEGLAERAEQKLKELIGNGKTVFSGH